MIIVVDYGMGNIGSICNAFRKIDAEVATARTVRELAGATKLVVPGVGKFDTGMRSLMASGLADALNRMVLEERIPILGICLGMELFTKRSEEGELPGFGWFDAETVRFRPEGMNARLRVPHMGWNRIRQEKDHAVVNDLFEMPDLRFYFVHSYYVRCNVADDVLTTSRYGVGFASAVQRDNIVGVQFHPEKSHKFGMRLLRNFASL